MGNKAKIEAYLSADDSTMVNTSGRPEELVALLVAAAVAISIENNISIRAIKRMFSYGLRTIGKTLFRNSKPNRIAPTQWGS